MKSPENRRGMANLKDTELNRVQHGHKPSGDKQPVPAIMTGERHGRQQVKIEQVMSRVYDRRRLRQAWHIVRRNAGAAGIDRMTVQDFELREEELLELIHDKLKTVTYRFKPVRKVEIPKPGSTKKRQLGIPVITDRIVSVSMALVLEEIYDQGFTASNFGFRRGKSQHQAIRHVQAHVEEGSTWCVSIDLKGFFDEIPHGLILKLIRRKIRDEEFVTLIARAIKAGVMENGKRIKNTKGTPQGSPVSPILSNIVLNELDQELERRGHRYCRWADDFIILVRTERAANRVMKGVTKYVEEELGLPVNCEKSRVAPVKDIEFLGFQILHGKIRTSIPSIHRFKDQVRRLTVRNNPYSMFQVIRKLNEFLRGWIGYFRIHEYKSLFRTLDTYIRNRLRSMQLKKWKKPKKFQRMMIRSGMEVKRAQQTWMRMKKWQSVKRTEVKIVLDLNWFRRMNLLFLDDYAQRQLKLSFNR